MLRSGYGCVFSVATESTRRIYRRQRSGIRE